MDDVSGIVIVDVYVTTDTMVDVCVERPVEIKVSVTAQGLVVKRIAALKEAAEVAVSEPVRR